MKKFFYIILAAVAAVACNELSPDQVELSGDQIVFGVNMPSLDVDVATKATAITSVSNVFWQALSGNAEVYAPASYAVDNGHVATGKYWPSTSTSFTYRVANVTFSSAGVIAATNATDIVAGTVDASYKTSPSVTLNHIFARTGVLTLVPREHYNLSNVSWQINSPSGSGSTGTAGNYTIGTGWASTGCTAFSSGVINATAGTGSDAGKFIVETDNYLIPGNYEVVLSFTETHADDPNYVKTYSFKTTDNNLIALAGGMRTNITVTVNSNGQTPGVEDAAQIEFSITVTPWDSETQTPTFTQQ